MRLDQTQKFEQALLDFINDYQERNGELTNFEIMACLEYSKLTWFACAREGKMVPVTPRTKGPKLKVKVRHAYKR